MNEYKLAWIHAKDVASGALRKNVRRRPMPDMMHLVQSSSGTGNSKFVRIFMPMVHHSFDVAATVNPFTPPKMRAMAISRIVDRID